MLDFQRFLYLVGPDLRAKLKNGVPILPILVTHVGYEIVTRLNVRCRILQYLDGRSRMVCGRFHKALHKE